MKFSLFRAVLLSFYISIEEVSGIVVRREFQGYSKYIIVNDIECDRIKYIVKK